jgi:hypothetical protein
VVLKNESSFPGLVLVPLDIAIGTFVRRIWYVFCCSVVNFEGSRVLTP